MSAARPTPAPLWAALVLSAIGAPFTGVGCAHRGDKPNPCADNLPSLVEVRDGQGTLQLAARALPGTAADATLCDGSGRPLGTLAVVPGGLAIKNAAGDIESRLEVSGGPDGDGEPRLTTRGTTVRLHGSGALLRVLDGAGIPLGQIEKQQGRAIAFDPAGRGIATAERVEKEDDSRLALRAPDGATQRITLGLHHERAAATFAIAALPLPEALLIARYLDGDQPAERR